MYFPGLHLRHESIKLPQSSYTDHFLSNSSVVSVLYGYLRCARYFTYSKYPAADWSVIVHVLRWASRNLTRAQDHQVKRGEDRHVPCEKGRVYAVRKEPKAWG